MEEKDRTNRQFYFGIIAQSRFKELALEVIPALEDRLNEQVDLRRYTDKFDQVFFIPVLDAGEEEIEESKYDEGSRKLSLKKTIRVNEIAPDIDEGQFTVLISDTFLKLIAGIKLVPAELMNQLRKVLDESD